MNSINSRRGSSAMSGRGGAGKLRRFEQTKQQLFRLINDTQQTQNEGKTNQTLKGLEQKCLYAKQENIKFFSINMPKNQELMEQKRMHQRINQITTLDYDKRDANTNSNLAAGKQGPLTSMKINESPYKRMPYETKAILRLDYGTWNGKSANLNRIQ